jgi:hypothetical protein
LETPFFTDSTIFSLRSSEYALMLLAYPAHHNRNLLSDASWTVATTQPSGLAPLARHRKPQLFAPWCAPVERRQGGVRAALIHEHQPLGDNLLSRHHLPSRSLELVALGGDSSPIFLVGPIRAVARHMVERLTESLVMTSM